jgi:uncharacterized PurR-regulated membrane protein YhhQ (DUF165 family)
LSVNKQYYGALSLAQKILFIVFAVAVLIFIVTSCAFVLIAGDDDTEFVSKASLDGEFLAFKPISRDLSSEKSEEKTTDKAARK